MASTEFDPPETEKSAGNPTPEELFTQLYRELHTLASRHLQRQGAGFTLSTTTLLHEAYLNLANRSQVQFPDRAQFLGYASRAMRGLIIDYVRRRSAEKRGGEFHLVTLSHEEAPERGTDADSLEEISTGLDQLAAVDPDLAELVDLHFFCGLSFVEIAGLRGVSARTVQRDWRKARLILHSTMRSLSPGGDPAE